jgi:hypothetical protein
MLALILISSVFLALTSERSAFERASRPFRAGELQHDLHARGLSIEMAELVSSVALRGEIDRDEILSEANRLGLVVSGRSPLVVRDDVVSVSVLESGHGTAATITVQDAVLVIDWTHREPAP